MLDSWDIAENEASNDAGLRLPEAADAEGADAEGADEGAMLGAADDGTGVDAVVGEGVVELPEHAAVSSMTAPVTAANLRILILEESSWD